MKIKICGLTRPQEAEILNQMQVDYAGFVLFCPKSKRNITCAAAREIRRALDPSIRTVAVTVSPSPDQIRAVEEEGFDLLQIHGVFSPEALKSVTLPVFRAVNAGNFSDTRAFRDCPAVSGFLFDAAEPGSGRTFDWSALSGIPRDEHLLILAGGLTPENVSSAIRAVHPDVVDVSSGVEYTDGRPGKDPDRVARFVRAAREAASR